MGSSFVMPAVVPEYFVSGVGSIEVMGTVARHVLVSERYVRGRLVYVPAVHIIISNANAQIAILKTARELALELTSRRLEPMH